MLTWHFFPKLFPPPHTHVLKGASGPLGQIRLAFWRQRLLAAADRERARSTVVCTVVCVYRSALFAQDPLLLVLRPCPVNGPQGRERDNFPQAPFFPARPAAHYQFPQTQRTIRLVGLRRHGSRNDNHSLLSKYYLCVQLGGGSHCGGFHLSIYLF